MAKGTTIGILILVIGITSKLSFAVDDCTTLSAFDRYKNEVCTKYNECSTGGEPQEQPCPYGLGYDEETKSCVWANQVQGCVVDADAAPSTDNCAGKPSAADAVDCAAGNVYNVMIDACVKKGSYVCEEDERLPDCSDKDAGYTDTLFISDKASCAGYFRCIKGVRYVGECPAGYYFNPEKQMCSYKSSTTKCDAFLSTTSASDNFDYENVCTGKAGQFVVDPRNCWAYIYCSTETKKSQSFCATGKYFNAGKCSSTAPKTCTCEIYGDMEDGKVKLAAHADKDKFYTCKKGQRILGQCASGAVWNDTVKSCKL